MILLRNCMCCNAVYGCKTESSTKDCKTCGNPEKQNCILKEKIKDITTGICDECFSNRRENSIRCLQ